QLVAVLGRIELPDLAEDPELAEQALHAERTRLVGHDRDDVLAELLVAQQRREDADERHRRRDLAIRGPLELGGERADLGRRQRLRLTPARGQRATQRGPALADELRLRRVLRGLVEAQVAD